MIHMITATMKYAANGVVGSGPATWFGSDALNGERGDWLLAPVGSVYVQVTPDGTIYHHKLFNNGDNTDWIMLDAGAKQSLVVENNAPLLPFLRFSTFTQSLGDNQLTNGDFETGDPPTGWTATNSAALAQLADARPESDGTNSIKVARNGAADPTAQRSFTAVANGFVEVIGWMKNVDGTDVRMRVLDTSGSVTEPPLGATTDPTYYPGTDWVQVGTIKSIVSSSSIRLITRATNDGEYGQFDDVTAKYITLNPQQWVPANIDLRLNLTLPATPFRRQRVMLMFRIADTLASGNNCCCVRLVRDRTNTQWDIHLVKFANGAETIIAETKDVGVPDAIRVKAHGANVQMYTSEGDSGWIPRCRVTELDWQTTATGVNVITATGMTATGLYGYYAHNFTDRLVGNRRYVLFGDSKTARGEWDYVFNHYAQMATGYKWTMDANLAVGGWHVGDARSNIDALLAAQPASVSPEIIMSNFGANDVDSGTLPSTYKGNYLYTLDAIHAKWPSATIYIANAFNSDQVTACNDMAAVNAEIVAERSFVRAGIDERAFLAAYDSGATNLADPKHPSTAGYVATALAWVSVVSL